MAGLRKSAHVLNQLYSGVYSELISLGCFPFFGTLLGLVRNGSMIGGDDDVDLACDVSRIEAAVKHITQEFNVISVNRQIDEKSGAGAVSLMLDFDEQILHLDLYAYKPDPTGAGLFPVHWVDCRDRPSKWLIVPIHLLEYCTKFPFDISSPIRSPDLELVCAYLYGPMWLKQLRKNIDYKHELVSGVPHIRVTSAFEKLMGLLRNLYSETYWGYRDLRLKCFKL